MRVEATVPDARAQALTELADDLGLSRSQVIDEALALFLKAVAEMRRGRRLVSMGQSGAEPVCEIITPTLAQLEWTAQRQSLKLPQEAVAQITDLVEHPPEPTPALRKLMASARR